jgi:hypothetical protein
MLIVVLWTLHIPTSVLLFWGIWWLVENREKGGKERRRHYEAEKALQEKIREGGTSWG